MIFALDLSNSKQKKALWTVSFLPQNLRSCHILYVLTCTNCFCLLTPCAQNITWTYLRHSEGVLNVFWTSFVRWIYVLCPGGKHLFFQKKSLSKLLLTFHFQWRLTCFEVCWGRGRGLQENHTKTFGKQGYRNDLMDQVLTGKNTVHV